MDLTECSGNSGAGGNVDVLASASDARRGNGWFGDVVLGQGHYVEQRVVRDSHVGRGHEGTEWHAELQLRCGDERVVGIHHGRHGRGHWAAKASCCI